MIKINTQRGEMQQNDGNVDIIWSQKYATFHTLKKEQETYKNKSQLSII